MTGIQGLGHWIALIGSFLVCVAAKHHGHIHHDAQRIATHGPFPNPGERNRLKITNMCPDIVWPGVISSSGVGPGIGGFGLPADHTMDLYVGSTWAGRVWGRTNCSFNAKGTGPSNLNGVGASGLSCMTSDCFGRLDCIISGNVPATIVEFTLTGGETGMQTFYDISLVDGYNLPMGIKYMPAKNTSNIPPNLTNVACIATSGYLSDPARTGVPDNNTLATNASYPIPLEPSVTNESVRHWCPWELQVYPPTGPGSGVYPYPDDEMERPVFDPCLSACAKTHRKEDCCTEDYNDPDICQPGPYSMMAKKVCPDAYSFAYDDTKSTFTIPKGGGWEVIFCPEGRSTDVMRRFGPQLREVAEGGGYVSDDVRGVARNLTYIYEASGGTTATVGMNLLFVWMAVGMGRLLAGVVWV